MKQKFFHRYDWLNILSFLVTLAVGFLAAWLIFGQSKGKTSLEVEVVETIPLNLLDSVYTEIFTLRLDHPEIVFSQALLESNKCKSKLFLENNNLFGMKISGSRPTTAKGVRNGYAYYSSWRESILDYALYQAAYRRNLSKEDYYEKLGSTYAEDPDYINKLKLVQ